VAANVSVEVPLSDPGVDYVAVQCTDNPDFPGLQVALGACAGWLNSVAPGQRDGICPVGGDPGTPTEFRYGTTPETKAKCKCEPLLLPLDIRGTITIIKNTVGGNGTFAYTHNVDGNSDPVVSTPFNITTSGGTGQQLFEKVVAGTYTVTESGPPAGWQFTSLTCSAGGAVSSQTATITLPAGGSVTCTYTNTKQGTITINKNAVPDAAQDFSFTTTGGAPLAAFSLDDDADPTLSNQKVFNNVPPGTYTVTEGADPTGWAFTSLTCSAGGATAGKVATITLPAGGSVTCTYVNTKQAKVRVIKTFQGLAITGSETFTFTLRTGATATTSGTILETLVANSGNGGTLNFTTFLTPGSSYQICEVVLPGWSSTILGLTGAFTIQTEPDGDNSTICVPFTPTAGETRTFTIDNTPPPGGLARTIGFWKNWASCSASKGNQAPVLDQTLALFPIAAGQTTHGVYIGDLYVDTCAEAVAILNKSDLSGQKKASDPAYNLAAQLLAAKLNIQAGAATCPAANTAIASAQTLLDAINFTGTGSYKSTMTATQIALANSLAATLDSYNNNTLCP
jgi:hypothetical protein